MVTLAFLDQYRYAICVVLVIVALIFICFGHIYREQVQLALKREFFRFPECSIDYWSLSHFLLFGIFGFLIPGYPLSFFVMGTGFEIVEDCLSSDKTTQLVDCTNKANKADNLLCRFSINDDYWYCNMTDPFVNLVGYITGSAIRTVFF